MAIHWQQGKKATNDTLRGELWEQLHALDETLDRFCERLESGTPFKKLLDGNVDLDFYIRFLIQTYHYVRFTRCSLKLAADSLVDHPNPIYQSLRQRFQEHQAEGEDTTNGSSMT